MISIKQCFYLENYGLFSSDFYNINFQNLAYINLSNNRITYSLPRKFGTLPLLQHLDLSQNCLGASNEWSWIEQSAIGRSLIYLDMSHNSLTELPSRVDKLDALNYLDISYNMLQRLPQNIGNLENLTALAVADNVLSCLPGKLMQLDRQIVLTITMNPFSFTEDNNVRRVQTLMELSANVILKHGIQYSEKLPRLLVDYLNKAESCYSCGQNFVGQWCKTITTYAVDDCIKKGSLITYSAELKYVPMEFLYCSFCCKIFYRGY